MRRRVRAWRGLPPNRLRLLRQVAQDGFDWEFASVPRSRAGAIVQQSALARRGLVLDIDFTGRSFPATLVQQYILATPGTYRMRGEYMASKLRWKPFELAFTIPPDCGAMASMQLQPAAQYEASTGMKGRISFDAFSLSPSPNSS